MRRSDMGKVIHFGYGGKQLIVNRTFDGHYEAVKLPDGTVVSLHGWKAEFEAVRGEIEERGILTIPAQPTRVELSNIDAECDCVVRAGLNKSGKNFLVDRLEFTYTGETYRVSPEVYPLGLIRIPQLDVNGNVMPSHFARVTEWNSNYQELRILSVISTGDFLERDASGAALFDKNDKLIFKPYVWATGPH